MIDFQIIPMDKKSIKNTLQIPLAICMKYVKKSKKKIFSQPIFEDEINTHIHHIFKILHETLKNYLSFPSPPLLKKQNNFESLKASKLQRCITDKYFAKTTMIHLKRHLFKPIKFFKVIFNTIPTIPTSQSNFFMDR